MVPLSWHLVDTTLNQVLWLSWNCQTCAHAWLSRSQNPEMPQYDIKHDLINCNKENFNAHHTPLWNFFDIMFQNSSLKPPHIGSISRPFSKFMIEFLSKDFFGFWAFMYRASFIFLPFQCFSLSIKTAYFHSTVWPLFLLNYLTSSYFCVGFW